jgi:hypothetical protein
MKILFTLIALEVEGNQNYLRSCLTLTDEILEKTNYDILISTNNVDYFNKVNSSRVFVRNNIKIDSILKYGNEFNYNLKHHAFKDIPIMYDCVIYLDCDIKLDSWKPESDELVSQVIKDYDLGADRTNCILGDEVNYLLTNKPCLFTHKINSYEILTRISKDDDLMKSQLPSEHFLILKNDPEKITKFQQKWEEMNDFLQMKNGEGGSWGDGFEIGISSRYAGMTKIRHTSQGDWDGILGLKFNGNKN